MTQIRGRRPGIARLWRESSFFRIFSVAATIASVIGLWAARDQLIDAVVRSDNPSVWMLLSVVLLLSFIVVLSAIRATVAASVSSAVLAVSVKLLARRASRLGSKPKL